MAQDGTPPEGVTLDFLALATVDSVPEDADTLFLFRVTFAPGASMPIDPRYGSGLVLSDMERGTLTVAVDGEVSVSKADAMPGTETVMPGGSPFTIAAGDSALFRQGLIGELRNEGTEEATVLALEAMRMPGAEAMATPAADEEMAMMNPEGIAFHFLAMGSLSDVPAGEIVLAISRVTYEPGVDAGPVPEPGTQVGVVESGTFALEGVAGPPVVIALGFGAAIESGGEPSFAELGPGDQGEVSAGDAASFPAGNVTEISNPGDVAATVLLGMVASMKAGS
jgi:hypothetical protein